MKLVYNTWCCSSIYTLYIPSVGGVPVVLGVLVLGDGVGVTGDSIGEGTIS